MKKNSVTIVPLEESSECQVGDMSGPIPTVPPGCPFCGDGLVFLDLTAFGVEDEWEHPKNGCVLSAVGWEQVPVSVKNDPVEIEAWSKRAPGVSVTLGEGVEGVVE